jgi:hypothetical protein
MKQNVLLRLFAIAILASISGCATVEQPRGELIDPTAVYIGDYGIHSSLFLPTQDNGFVEYAFGDWGYAVENRNMPQDAIGALTASWGAGFGRMYHDRASGSSDPDPPRKPLVMHKVTCDRSDIYALIDRLDVRFETLARKHGAAVVNPETGMSWVREEDDKHYSIANNCNHQTVRSLKELGCRVSGVVVWSKFNVKEPANSGRPAKPAESRSSWASIE